MSQQQRSVTVPRQQEQTKALTVREVKDELDAIRPQLIEVLPQRMDPDRFLRVVAGAVLKSPAIMKATATQEGKISLFRAVLESAQLGLEPTGLLGSAYLVPYGNTINLIPGYRGLIDLARRSGEIESIYAQLVRARDHFRMTQGTEPGIEHEPYIPPPLLDPNDPDQVAAQDRGPVIGGYMVAVLRDRSGQASVRQIEWMTYAEIEAVRKRSKASANGPWVTDWDEMARKTLVRRGAKYLPLSPEAVHGFSLDEEAERDASAPETGAARRQSGRSRVLAALSRRTGVSDGPLEEQEGGKDDRSDAEEGESREVESEGEAVDPSAAGNSCGAVPPDDGMGLSVPCSREAGHKGAHRSDEGSWPA